MKSRSNDGLFFLREILVKIINERISCGPESVSKGTKAASQGEKFNEFMCEFVYTI